MKLEQGIPGFLVGKGGQIRTVESRKGGVRPNDGMSRSEVKKMREYRLTWFDVGGQLLFFERWHGQTYVDGERPHGRVDGIRHGAQARVLVVDEYRQSGRYGVLLKVGSRGKNWTRRSMRHLIY